MAYKKSIELSSNTTATLRALRLPKDSRYLAKRIWTALLSSVTCATVLGVPSLITTTLTTTITTPWGLQIQRSNEAAIAQTATPPVLPTSLPQGSSLTIEGSGSLAAINKALKEQYESKYQGTPFSFSTEGTAAGLKALDEGKVDLAAIGRTLTQEEIAKGFIAIPIKREKIAMLVGENNPFRGSLTIHQFAKIFRGEITNWSEVGGPNKPIRLVDQPEASDTRNAFPNYPVFKSAPFQAVSSAIASGSENPQDVASKLGDDGLGYITADGLKNVTGARALDMHQTQPDDPRYPFSQPIAYVYKKGRLSPAAQAFLGSLNTEEAKAAIQSVSSPGVVLADSSALVGAAIAGAATGAVTGTPGAATGTPTPTGSPSPTASGSPVAAIANNAPAGTSNSTDTTGNTTANAPANASGNQGAAGAMATTNPVDGGFPFWLWPVFLGLGAAGLLWWLLKGKEGNRSAIEESPSSASAIPVAGVESADGEGNVPNLESPNLDPNPNPDLLPGAGMAGVAAGAAALAATGLPIVETDPRNQTPSARILPEEQEAVVAIDHDVEIHGEGSAEMSPREVQGDAGGLQFPAIDPLAGAAIGLAGGAVAAGIAAGVPSEPSSDAVEPMDSRLIVGEDVGEDVVVGGELTEVATPIVPPDLPEASIADSDELEPPAVTLPTDHLPELPVPTDSPNENATGETATSGESTTDESATSGVLPIAGIAGAAAVAGIAGVALSHESETPRSEGMDGPESVDAPDPNLEAPSAIAVEEPIEKPIDEPIDEPNVPAVMLPHEPITQLPPAIQEPTVLESLEIQASSSQSSPNEPMQPPSNEFPAPISQNDEQSHEPSTELNTEPNNIALGMVGAAAGIAAGIAANTAVNTTVNRSLTPADLAGVDDQLPDLPQGYGESRIVLMARDPQWGYTYWDIPDEHRQGLRGQGGQQLALRLYDVTDLDINTQNPHSLQQYACDELARDWYLPIPVSDRDYITEIGYLSGTGAWLLLARSNIVRIPPVYPSDWMDDQFITVDFEENLQGRTFLQLVPPGSLAAQTQGQSGEFNNPVFGVSQADQAARMAGSLFGSMHQIPAEALSSFVFPSGAGLWANESGAEFWTLPTPSGMGMSGVGYTMSGIGFGASMPPERSRKFWLVADAELIIYGATEPDAQLTIGGVPVQLSPEGTFRLQMSFQDGNLDFPIMAIAKDGEQMRQIRMTFDRSTPLRKTNTKEEAQEENY